MDLTKLERKPDENIKDWPQVCTVSIFFPELKEYFKVTGLQSLDEAETQAVTLSQGLTQNSSKTETQFAEMLRLKWRFSRALLSWNMDIFFFTIGLGVFLTYPCIGTTADTLLLSSTLPRTRIEQKLCFKFVRFSITSIFFVSLLHRNLFYWLTVSKALETHSTWVKKKNPWLWKWAINF